MFSVLFATFIVLIVLVHKIRSYYWVNRGVPGPKPWPVVGNIAEHMFGRKTIGQVITDIYRYVIDRKLQSETVKRTPLQKIR